MVIKKLSPELINKIAAGEVVERPASVVKELVENSLDAKAQSIEITVKNAGKTFICVKDDGIGMDKKDAVFSIEQHATSKISDINDLFSIMTFGFRGEALASISAVGDFILQTKDSKSLEGTEVKFIDNKKEVKPISCNRGAKVIVKNLFKNIPARRNFLKSDSTEYSHILDVFEQFALSNPDIYFKLINNEKVIYNLPATDNLSERITQLLGKDIAGNLMKFSHRDENMVAHGFIGKPSASQPNRNNQFFYINKRFVYNNIVNKAVSEAFSSLIPNRRFPCYLINLEVDPKEADVNVHPRKAEVRFKNSQNVFRFLLQAVRICIKENNIIKKIDFNEIKFEPKKSSYPISQLVKEKQKSFNISRSKVFGKSGLSLKPNTAKRSIEFNSLILEQDAPNPDLGSWILLGQIKNSYLLVEDTQRGILLIDQHAASERINYEKISKNYYSEEIKSSQRLLMPVSMELSLKEFNLIISYKKDLEKIGFEISEFGANTVIINSVPSLIKDKDVQKILKELITEQDNEKLAKSDTIEYLLKTISCKAAIKFGDALSKEAQLKLLQDLKKINNRMSCAHGRPIILELTWEEVKRMFERG